MIKEKTIGIANMHCSACSLGAEKQLNKIDGVIKANVFLTTNSAVIKYDSKKVNNKILKDSLKKAGFDLVDIKKANTNLKDDKSYQSYKKRMFIALIITFIMMFLVTQNINKINITTQFILSIISMILGYNFYKSGIPSLFKLNPNMDSLVSLGTISCFLYSFVNLVFLYTDQSKNYHFYFEAVCMIISFVMLGKTLEKKSRSKTNKELEKLLNLTPSKTLILKDGKQVLVNTDLIVKDDLIVIKPFDILSVDGVVVKGQAVVDQSMLTGESIPVNKEIGDFVYSGSINQNSSFIYKACKVGSETSLNNIIKIIKDSVNSKAHIQTLVDKVSRIFVPFIICASILCFTFWMIYTKNFYLSLKYGVTILVIACPCALGLATPIGLTVSFGKASSLGLLFKKATSLEALAKVNALVFDKTGTLTIGKPIVTKALYKEKINDLETCILSSEKLSNHPLALTLVKYFEEKNVKTCEVQSFESFSGKGIISLINNDKYIIGSKDFVFKYCSKDFEKESLELEKDGNSLIFVGKNNKIKALYALKDNIRDESFSVIEKLNKLNIKTYLLTGDNKENANLVAKKLNIKNTISQVLPNDKANFVKKLQKENKIVAMIGDGVNDAPSLSVSDVSISISNASDIAIENSDIILTSNNLNSLITSIKLSYKTMRIIKQNLFFSFIYNIFALFLATGVLTLVNGPSLTPGVASLCMSLSSVSVVLNSLRLYRFHE